MIINSSSTPATLDTSFMEGIVAFLNTLYDVVIERGLLRVVHLVSESITTEELTTAKEVVTESFEFGTEEKPIGFVMYDESNGKPYCITIKKGEFVKTKGSCEERDDTSDTGGSSGSGNSIDEPVIGSENNTEPIVSDQKEAVSVVEESIIESSPVSESESSLEPEI